MVDPRSTDNTYDILNKIQTDYPNLYILNQDITLGDSTNDIKGKDGNLTMHMNMTKFVNENIPVDKWFMCLDVDERLDPDQWVKLEKEIEYCKEYGYDSISLSNIIEPIEVWNKQLYYEYPNMWYLNLNKPKSDVNLGYDYSIDYRQSNIYQIRIWKNFGNWKHNNKPHSGYNSSYNNYNTSIPLLHYHRIKYREVKASNWRDGLNINRFIGNGEKVRVYPIRAMVYSWYSLIPLDGSEKLKVYNERLLKDLPILMKKEDNKRLQRMKKYDD